MNLDQKGFPVGVTNQSTVSKGTILNPNAAEFIPSSLRGVSPRTTSSANATSIFIATRSFGKKVLDRPESSISTNSDEESRQYWQRQLPDDITPDFKVIGGEDSEGIGGLSIAGLSLLNGSEANQFSASLDIGYSSNKQLELSPRNLNGSAFSNKIRYPLSSYEEELSPTGSLHMSTKPWYNQAGNNDHLLGNGSFEENFGPYPNDLVCENPTMENSDVNPLEFLASQFPGFAADSLAEVYFANYCDLHSTMEMLTQLELQVDGGINANPNSKTLPAPNISSMDFPALSPNKASLSKYVGEDVPQSVNPFRSSDKGNMLLFESTPSLSSNGSIDFASAVRKLASQDSNLWKYDRNGSGDSIVGSSRLSSVLMNAYNSGPTRSGYGDRLQNRGSAGTTPVWLETGEAVANMYSELRGEARDHARIRNAYFEQARQAYLIGNKDLAKELSEKGQLHNMHMKAAHTKAQESIYQKRNQGISELLRGGRWQEKMIDLHGLHVNEALHVLKHELAALRIAARSYDQRWSVCICVGTGHHTRGSRTPARLPIAVQRYLLEEEALDYSEPQPAFAAQF
ncbi:hypothetical protein Dimus_036814 [Dionaea muscipula]